MNYEIFKSSFKKLIEFYTFSEFEAELALGKQFFFENTGSLDETKSNFDLRLNQFYEWFFLTRKLSSHMKTPLDVCDQQRGLRLSAEDIEVVKILRESQDHRIYEFLKSKDKTILVRDLFSVKKIEIEKEQLVFGFDTKEYFQARTVKLNGKYYFLNSFCFHPEASQKFIQSEIKRLQKDPDVSYEELLMRLNKMRYKFEQYRHVKPESIYTNENKLGL